MQDTTATVPPVEDPIAGPLFLVLFVVGLIWWIIWGRKMDNPGRRFAWMCFFAFLPPIALITWLVMRLMRNRPGPRSRYVHGFAAFLDRTDVLIIDTETTGLSKESEVIQIGIIDTQGNILYESLCEPQGRLLAQDIHGINQKRMSAEGRPFPEVYAEVQEILRGAAAVWAWNMPFDRRLLKQSCDRYGLTLPRLHWRCSMREYADVSKYASSRIRLETAVHKHNVQISAPAHSAVGDCLRVLEVMRAVGK